MRIFLLIFILQNFITSQIKCQSFGVDELVTLANMPSKDILHYMKKKGFILSANQADSGEATASFTCSNKKDPDYKRGINIYTKENSKYFAFYTSAVGEYQQGQKSLTSSGFFYDTLKDISKESSMLFQKANITICTSSEMKDGIMQYNFLLKEKEIPSSLIYAEDLLQFDSHEFLVSFFGQDNVKKDIYYLSEKELKKCSVLFSGTPRQAVFVWEDDTSLKNLLYILVTNSLPTEGAKKSYPLSQNNEWRLKNGICPGMSIKDLLRINEIDFDIYGNKSDMAFLVKPNNDGKIDFKKTAVMLSCHECFDNKIFNQKEVSALEVAKANLPMYVFDVVIYSTDHK